MMRHHEDDDYDDEPSTSRIAPRSLPAGPMAAGSPSSGPESADFKAAGYGRATFATADYGAQAGANDHHPNDRQPSDRQPMGRGPGRHAQADWRRAAPRKSRGKGFAVVSALVAGTAFVGFIWYSYSGGNRGALGITEPPLIQADQAPFKMRPEQPGGLKVPHQDKLVFDRLNPALADGRGKIERLLPPPESPLPRPEPPPRLTPPSPPAAVAASNTPVPATMPDGAPIPRSAPVAPVGQTPLPALPHSVPTAPAAPPVVASVTQAPRPSAQPSPTQPAAAPAVAKPAAPVLQAASKPPAAPAASQIPTAPAASQPPAAGGGGFKIQLASVRSEAEAQSEWKRLQGRYPSALGSLSLMIKRADLGEKGIYFRVQGGSVDESRARTICSELKAENVGCQLVRP